MASGVNSNSVTSKRWRAKQELSGKKRFVVWLEGDLKEAVLHYAFKEMVPPSVGVEMIIREKFNK